jgi:uncharacterized repeat protein (TIGR02543 family)/LPXTG-motif cell wall-anchored protein
LNGVVSGEDVTLTIGTPSFEDKNVGTDKSVHFTGLSISGDDAGNYSLIQPTVKADITPKGLTISGTKVEATKTYDGTTAATITDPGQLSGVISGDTVTLSQGTAAYTDKNVGTGKTVSFTGFTLTGADARNYQLSAQPADATADITKATLTAAYLGDSLTFGETPHYTVQVSGFVNRETAETAEGYVAPVIAEADRPDLTRNIAISVTLTPSGGRADNYQFHYVGGSFVMNQKTYTVTFDGNGGTPGADHLVTSPDFTLETLPTAVREGYTFRGWYTDRQLREPFTTDTIVDRDLTVYAGWKKAAVPSDEAPDTGDGAEAELWSLTGLAALAGALFLAQKRRRMIRG